MVYRYITTFLSLFQRRGWTEHFSGKDSGKQRVGGGGMWMEGGASVEYSGLEADCDVSTHEKTDNLDAAVCW